MRVPRDLTRESSAGLLAESVYDSAVVVVHYARRELDASAAALDQVSVGVTEIFDGSRATALTHGPWGAHPGNG